MKKILVINTTYKEKGGEDTNIVDEINFLKENYVVEYIEFKNSEKLSINDFLAFFRLSNIKSNNLLKEKLHTFNPDLVYIHNTWFKANLGIFKLLKDGNYSVYIKLHNFRYYCTRFFSISRHLGARSHCSMCSLEKKGIYFNKYFQDSYLKSFFVILYGKKYYKILKNYGFNLLVMTNFQKTFLEKLGFNKEKIDKYINPTSYSDNFNYDEKSDYIVYAGRVTSEKGVPELIEAWNKANINDINLKIVGGGELLNLISKNNKNKNVEFLGELDHHETLKIIKKSRGVVTATKMYEGQPRLLCEALVNGIPSLFPEYGGMSEFFPKEYILKFDQYNYEDLKDKIKLFEDESILKKISNDLFKYSNETFNKEKLLKKFESITTKNN